MTSFREAHATPYPDRYLARDFYRLANGRASSSITPDYDAADEFLAEQTNNRRTISTADRRPTVRPCDSQTPKPDVIIRQSSFSSVKEDDSGRRILLNFYLRKTPRTKD